MPILKPRKTKKSSAPGPWWVGQVLYCPACERPVKLTESDAGRVQAAESAFGKIDVTVFCSAPDCLGVMHVSKTRPVFRLPAFRRAPLTA